MLMGELRGVGDEQTERVFRMCLTLCFHRALTKEEEVLLPDGWSKAPYAGIAGGPVEIIRQNVPSTPSCLPCEDPTKLPLSPHDASLWIPGDCGRCEPCKAREACLVELEQ